MIGNDRSKEAKRSARPPREYHRSLADARGYQRRGVAYMATIYMALVAAMIGWISIPLLFAVTVVAYARGALLTHELMHMRRPDQVAWPLRMMMLFDTPLGLGYREHQDIHVRHHREPATEADPEFFQIRGGRVRAFLAAMVSPEVAAMRWVAEHGIGPQLRREATVRALIMLTLVALNPPVFLAYWLTLRMIVGVSSFFFHHATHYRGGLASEPGVYGTFALRLARPLDGLLRLVLGSSLAPVLSEHDAHHAWWQVKGEHLRGLLAEFPPPVQVEGEGSS